MVIGNRIDKDYEYEIQTKYSGIHSDLYFIGYYDLFLMVDEAIENLTINIDDHGIR